MRQSGPALSQVTTLSIHTVETQLGCVATNQPQFNFEHPLVLEDLVDLVVDNPLVPPGHEELFARGFLRGFGWNLAESLSILVPQLENALRHALARAGREVTTRDKHRLQNFIQMGRMLSEYREDLEAMFGMTSCRS